MDRGINIVNVIGICNNNYIQNETNKPAVINPDNILITSARRGYIIQTA
jgi:hypothetical protein